MTTVTTMKHLHAAILDVHTLSSGRSKVTFRTGLGGGKETAHTALLTTVEGQAMTRELRRRQRSWPMSLLRTTPVELTVETLADGSTLRIISAAKTPDHNR
ncbi:MAG TPA: hypothetical protein VF867_14325 [Arthrobacter sp.]